MTRIVLFHHAQGLTDGVVAFADTLRAAGHQVSTPDLYEGRTFERLDEGVAHAEQVGFDTILERGRLAAAALEDEPVVFAGFSLGVMPAEMLALTRPGARAALLVSGCVPPAAFNGGWPEGLRAQVHLMEEDPVAQEDLEAAQRLAEEVPGVDLFLYPGSAHLFADPSLGAYEPDAAAILTERSLAFLSALGS